MTILKAALCAAVAVCAAPTAVSAAEFTADFTKGVPSLPSGRIDGNDSGTRDNYLTSFRFEGFNVRVGPFTTVFVDNGLSVFTETYGIEFSIASGASFDLRNITFGPSRQVPSPVTISYVTAGGTTGSQSFAQSQTVSNSYNVAIDGIKTLRFNYYLGDFRLQSFSGVVPEPSTWALMLAGFGLTGYALRRRRARVVFA